MAARHVVFTTSRATVTNQSASVTVANPYWFPILVLGPIALSERGRALAFARFASLSKSFCFYPRCRSEALAATFATGHR